MMNWAFWIAWALALIGFLVSMLGYFQRAIRLKAFYVWQARMISTVQTKTGVSVDQFEPTKVKLGWTHGELIVIGGAIGTLAVLVIALLELVP